MNPIRAVGRVRALSSLLQDAGDPKIDLLSLDVEDAELEAVAGLDLTRHRPRYNLVETARPQAVADALGDGYRPVE